MTDKNHENCHRRFGTHKKQKAYITHGEFWNDYEDDELVVGQIVIIHDERHRVTCDVPKYFRLEHIE